MAGRRTWCAVALVALGVPGLLACNMITGADGVALADDDGGVSANAAGPGATTAGPAAGPSVGNGGSTVNGAGGSTANTGAGAGPTECIYPPPPYGVAQGQVLPPTLSWQGFAPGASTPSTINVEDFFDCDGSRDIDAVVFDTAQFG